MAGVERAAVGPDERVKAIVSVEVLLRIMRKAKDCFPDDDLETILVYLTVAAASTGSHLRDAPLLESLDGGPLPDHLHRPTSARGVAQSTGLARETVRRRIAALVADGRLARDGRGIRTLTNTFSKNRNAEFARFLIHELATAQAKLARYDQAR